MTLPADSGFWAFGRLSPFGATGFNVQNVPVDADMTWVEAFADGIAVWSKAGSTFARSHPEARVFLEIVTAAYTLVSGVALDFAFSGWVEAKEANFKGTVIGFRLPRGPRPTISATSKRSRDMGKAIEVALAVWHRGPWRLAVRDVHAAHLAADQTDDAFVFAYRAIEDLTRAWSPNGKKSWSDLRTHLGTTEPKFRNRTRRLFDARNAVAHGDENDPALAYARSHTKSLIRLSRTIVREAFAAESSLPSP
jgi:hypothetical protein